MGGGGLGSVHKRMCACVSSCVIRSITCVLSPPASSLSSLLHRFSTSLLLHLAFFSFTPFDDEKLIAAPGHETKRGRETESHVDQAEGQIDGMSQGRKDKCLRSLVMSGDRSPAGMISATVIDSFPPVLR